MKVLFCVLLLEFFFSVIHASTTDNTAESEISTTPFSFTGSTGHSNVITENTDSVTPANYCYFPHPPVPQYATNSSAAVIHPKIAWSLNISYESCGNITLSVSCKNIEHDTDSVTIDYNDITNTTEFSTQLKLKERTTFRCYGKLKATHPLGESAASDTIVVTTIIRDKINITNTNHSATNIFIEWAEISNETKLTYDVEITEINAVHFSPNCEKSNSSISMPNFEKTFYNFPALPDHKYSIVISTTIRGNTIDSDVPYVITDPAAPDEPRNVLVVDPSIEDDGSPNITKVVTWDIPCHPNGQIQRFEINLTGIYTPDLTRHQPMTINFTKIPPKQTQFEQTLNGLWASTNYTLSIRAVGENNEAGPGVESSFRTRDAIPAAPLVSITRNSSSHLEIQWQPSVDIRYGKIARYNLNISPVGPAYGLYPSDCPAQNSFHVQLDGAITSYNNYTNANSFWIYEISVTASTSRGTGPNGSRTVTTLASAPDKPRSVFLDDPVDSDISKNVKKIIRWDVPCFANDRITSYLVQLNGSHTLVPSYNDIREIAFNVTPDQKNFSEILENLHPSTEYNFSIRARGENVDKGIPVSQNFTTREAIPDAPVLNKNQFTISNSSISFMVNPPNEEAGKIILYKIIVTKVAPLFLIPADCSVDPRNPINVNITRFHEFPTLPYHTYKIDVAAATQIGLGDFTTEYVNTSSGVPEAIRDLNFSPSKVLQEEYDAKAFIKFKRPCLSNGPLTGITINYKGNRISFENISYEEPINFSNETNLEYTFGLKPEYFYEVTITTDNGHFSNISKFNMSAPSGVPPKISPGAPELSGSRPTGIDVTLRREHLNNTNGDIKYISLILSETSKIERFAEWNGTNWPVVFDETKYQLTTDFWAPLKDVDVAKFSIGSDSPGCNKSKKFCNEPLKEDKEYFLIVRMFTKHFYRDNPAISFRTSKSWTGFICGMIFGILLTGVLAIVAFFLWRKGVFKIIMDRILKKTPVEPALSKGIPCNKFLQYCKNLECNPQKYHEQYALLTEKAKEMTADKTICIATLLENRRKNRYTNIAPYDQTRVELRIDEDDEIGSDYINASFIKGYSGNVEYIATQGPMATTTRDFWKMVLQENVTMIVMVSQFVENGKEKCHRYFPKNHESMIISDDMEVRCSIELHFGTYCVRNLQVRKDEIQATVTHMQFLDWPDFGVPVGTDNLLQFCYQLRDRHKMEGGLIIVHCSAGVGRTGTLIATDILLQSANAGKPIDVFSTVLELRKQRVMMVQTDKQYIFIHNMLKEHLDRPPTPDPMENSEPMYENMEIIKHSRDSEILMNKKEDESEF